MKMVSAGAAGLDYRDGSPAASRSEEEDRELVLRRRGPTALDLRLLRHDRALVAVADQRSAKSRAEREAKLEALLTQVEPGGESSEEKGGE